MATVSRRRERSFGSRIIRRSEASDRREPRGEDVDAGDAFSRTGVPTPTERRVGGGTSDGAEAELTSGALDCATAAAAPSGVPGTANTGFTRLRFIGAGSSAGRFTDA